VVSSLRISTVIKYLDMAVAWLVVGCIEVKESMMIQCGSKTLILRKYANFEKIR
jgi:hypothetical protein